MKKIAVSFAIFSLAVSTASAELKVEADRFTGKVSATYTSEKHIYHEKAGKMLFHAFRIKGGDDGDSSFLFISYVGRSWRYLRCESTHWLLDGKPFDLPAPKFNRDTMRGGVSETLIQDFDEAQLRAMASATTLEVKICNDEISIPKEDIHGLAELAEAQL